MSEIPTLTDPPLLDETGLKLCDLLSITTFDVKRALSWSDAPDSYLPEIMESVYAGEIDLEEDLGWQVGDERRVPWSGYTEHEYPCPELIFVLTDKGHYDLTEGGKCKFTLVTKYGKSLYNAWDGANNGWQSYDKNDSSNGIRYQLNTQLYSYLPPGFRAILKQFKAPIATTYNGSSVKYIDEYLTLPSEMELLGTRIYSNPAEAAACTQLDYFKDITHRSDVRAEDRYTSYARCSDPDYRHWHGNIVTRSVSYTATSSLYVVMYLGHDSGGGQGYDNALNLTPTTKTDAQRTFVQSGGFTYGFALMYVACI